MLANSVVDTRHKFLQGGGEMGELIRSYDWSTTSIGEPDVWPQSLRTSISIMLNSKFPMFLFWGKDLICFYNDAFRPSLGNEGKHPWALGKKGELVWAEIWHIIKPWIDQVLFRSEAVWMEDQLVGFYRNGRMEDIYWTFSYSPVSDETGHPAGVFVTCTETTQKVETLKALNGANEELRAMVKKAEQSEARFRLLADSMPQFVWTTSPQGKLEYFNEAGYIYSGLSSEVVLKEGWLNVVHPEDREENVKRWNHSIQTGEDFIFHHRFRKASGEYRWQLSRAVPLREVDGKIIMWIGTSTDIHEQKLFEEELNKQVLERTRELEKAKELLQQGNVYLQNIINKFESAIATLVPIYENGKIIDFYFKMTNEVYSHYSKIPPGDIQGLKVGDVFPGYFQTDAFSKYVYTFTTGEPNAWELHYDADGLDVYLQVFATRMDEEIVVHFIDNTKLKNLQIDLLRKIEELERSNRNLEEFAYAASHDLKEPIRKIHFFSDRLKNLLRESLTADSSRLFDRLQVATQRMRSLVEDLLSYSQVNTVSDHLEKVNLNTLVKIVLEDLELEIEQKQANIVIKDLPEVHGHFRQLQQLFQNLLSNGLKYGKPGVLPKVFISASQVHGYESGFNLSALENKNLYHRIEVLDNGIGFEQEDAERIFQVFQRLHTAAEYQGTGLGLSIARKVAENHHGFLSATSEPNKGAKFILLLPVEN